LAGAEYIGILCVDNGTGGRMFKDEANGFRLSRSELLAVRCLSLSPPPPIALLGLDAPLLLSATTPTFILPLPKLPIGSSPPKLLPPLLLPPPTPLNPPGEGAFSPMIKFVTFVAATLIGPLSLILSNEITSSAFSVWPLVLEPAAPAVFELFPKGNFHMLVFFDTAGTGVGVGDGDTGDMEDVTGNGNGGTGPTSLCVPGPEAGTRTGTET
jgi:hypothetical protein